MTIVKYSDFLISSFDMSNLLLIDTFVNGDIYTFSDFNIEYLSKSISDNIYIEDLI